MARSSSAQLARFTVTVVGLAILSSILLTQAATVRGLATPTPLRVVTSAPAWTVTPLAAPDETLQKLGEDIYAYLRVRGFRPGTKAQGAAFVMSLRTGQAITVDPDVAFSAASLSKILILVSLYRKLSQPPTRHEAALIAGMMVCSKNDDANEILSILGGGDRDRGTAYVTETAQRLGLTHTLMARSFYMPVFTPTPVPATPYTPPSTGIDQRSAQPDPFNQTTPADLGWLLAGLYRCAVDGSGPITAVYPGELTMAECRQVVQVMLANRIQVMIEAGVPDGIPVAHKHGWVEDTHGDAALVFTPGGDYVLVVILHNKSVLTSGVSYTTVAEISRMTYNAFNPSQPLEAAHTRSIPACAIGADLVRSLQSPDAPPIP
jgi:beta-lactamase class A